MLHCGFIRLRSNPKPKGYNFTRFYERETWSLTLKEKCKLAVSENRVLRIFGPKKDEVKGPWRKQHKGEVHSFTLH
jgi:hypothetical protein